MTRRLRQGYGHPGGARWVDEGWRTAPIDPETGDIEGFWVYAGTLSDHRLDMAGRPEGTMLAVERVDESRTGWERTGTLAKVNDKVVYQRAKP
jgi:hypothetical protein